MTEETKHIYLFFAFGGVRDKYTPGYDEKRSIPSVECAYDIGYGSYRRNKFIDTKEINLVFECDKVKTEKDEKKLRSCDVIMGEPGGFIFVNDLILSCLHHLIDKDIQILPGKIYTPNGVVDGYHLIDIINIVHGVDNNKSTYSKFTGYLDKLVPKNEDFMEGHELAREYEQKGSIYIIPELREKILKAKKGKLKGLEMITTKKYWEDGHNIKLCPY